MRADDGEDLLAGYVSGPAAATEATAMALVRADPARTVVLVEGVSDQIAVETLARRHGRDLAAEAAVVRQYFRIINHLDTDMDAAALARLMTPACPCHKLERSVRDEAAHERHYFGTARLNRVQAHLDGPALGDVLVDFDATVGGVRTAAGAVASRTPARRHVNWDFVLVHRGGTWLINRIDQT